MSFPAGKAAAFSLHRHISTAVFFFLCLHLWLVAQATRLAVLSSFYLNVTGGCGKHSDLFFNSCPTRCDLFSLLYFCRQLYMFQVLTPIIRSSFDVFELVKLFCLFGINKCYIHGSVHRESIHDARTHICIYKKFIDAKQAKELLPIQKHQTSS